MEGRDIDDMIEAISAYRRRAGRRDAGEELADELIRGTWDDYEAWRHGGAPRPARSGRGAIMRAAVG